MNKIFLPCYSTASKIASTLIYLTFTIILAFSVEAFASSPAERAKQTVYAVVKELDISKKEIHFNDKIYMASLESLLRVLGEIPKKAHRVMLVGHNPGLDDLLQYLVKDPPLTESGKLLTTACLARITLPQDWIQLQRHCGSLIDLTRPRDFA